MEPLSRRTFLGFGLASGRCGCLQLREARRCVAHVDDLWGRGHGEPRGFAQPVNRPIGRVLGRPRGGG